eukprot:CAMPEP_0119120688 /NCGR_PEP_ID=MMETSP1310-20130426/1625_1 /TAXON_ID=464262 /ORGANISM="Genus nov. species nov., Strain RCC2339" /LENGTH=334 /DNA_ID=CAMNT_0007110183 /DNA_START=251 /DNA_END=1251 /DNA_ORIENTATION=+
MDSLWSGKKGSDVVPEKESCRFLDGLLRRPENERCADCLKKGPRWASTNLGVFFCIDCSGIHRSLGTHITKVKSVNLDKWTVDQLRFIGTMGNARAAQIWEAKLPESYPRPSSTDKYAVANFIRAKYQDKRWFNPPAAQTAPRDAVAPQQARSTPTKSSSSRSRKNRENRQRHAPSAAATSAPPASNTPTFVQGGAPASGAFDPFTDFQPMSGGGQTGGGQTVGAAYGGAPQARPVTASGYAGMPSQHTPQDQSASVPIVHDSRSQYESQKNSILSLYNSASMSGSPGMRGGQMGGMGGAMYGTNMGGNMHMGGGMYNMGQMGGGQYPMGGGMG